MNNRNLTILILSSVCLVLGIIAAELFYAKTFKLENEISVLNQSVRDLELQESKVLSSRQIASPSINNAKELDQYFISDKGALDFVKYIEGLAASSGLTSKIDVLDEVADPLLAEQGKEFFKAAIRTNGTYNNSRIFLNLIESLPYNVKINRVDLRRSGDAGSWTLLVDFSVVKTIDN